jgi:toxin FitB
LNYLLDTNVLSEWTKIPPDSNVVRWFLSTDEESLWVSAVTFAEIRFGIALLPEGRRKQALLDWLQEEVRARFYGRIIEVELRVADAWGVLMAKSWALGTPLPVVDAYLAATALVHEMTIVTRNTRHFQNLGIALLDPWTASSC